MRETFVTHQPLPVVQFLVFKVRKFENYVKVFIKKNILCWKDASFPEPVFLQLPPLWTKNNLFSCSASSFKRAANERLEDKQLQIVKIIENYCCGMASMEEGKTLIFGGKKAKRLIQKLSRVVLRQSHLPATFTVFRAEPVNLQKL